MAKKKKAGAKKKKAGSGEKGKKGGKESGSKKKKGPTQKELFEMQVEELRQKMEASILRLSELQEDLASSRGLLGQEAESKQSCVSILERNLRREFDRCRAMQDRLQTERDLSELVESRALGKFAATEGRGEAARSLFLQQKAELEGKLSLLEELRLERSSQAAHLRRAEATLEERTSALRVSDREEDCRQADGLLRNREAFLVMCGEVRSEFRSAFALRLPVHAENQLREDVRLRAECGRAVDALLAEQGQSRRLRAGQRALDLEEEVQLSAEEWSRRRREKQEKQIGRLMKAQRDLLSNQAGVAPQQEEIVTTPKRLELAADDAVTSRAESILSREVERCRLSDRREELAAIVEDQGRHRTSLRRQMDEALDINGAMISGILRAEKIFKSRTGKSAPGSDPDYEVLMQMRLLLDLAARGSSGT